MDTGYGTCTLSAPPYGYTLSETISTSTSTGGLNPLPRGSISITWSAATANFSDFGGYIDAGLNPPYNILINNVATGVIVGGEDQVYENFLRDGVNFGPPGGADNTGGYGGYNIDMTGLHSVFTNTPFVVELIASSDSMQLLTNAYIADVTHTVTNSVTYPNTAPVVDAGSAPWVRGHGGGLSVASAAFAIGTDHLNIQSAMATHGGTGGPPTGYDNAGTISGFIITDQPVITMSPQPVPVGLGDTITWGAYAIGVPPLHYQWLKNGVPISGATSLSYSLTNVTTANVGIYSLLVTNLYGSATSSVVSVDEIIQTANTNLVLDSNPKGPAHDGLDFGATWLASFTDPNGTNRTGVMSFNGTNNQITVPAFSVFNSTNGTVMFWMQTTQNPSGGSATLFDRYTDTNSDGVRISMLGGALEGGTLNVQYGGNTLNSQTVTVNDGNWHHVAVSYDQTGVNGTSLYVDGTLVEEVGGNPFSIQPSQEVELGLSHIITATALVPYQGLISDFRFYTTNLTAGQIASVFSSNALVDTNDLALRLNFAAPPSSGLVLTWQVPDGILQSAPSVNGTWADVGVTESKYVTTPSQPALLYRYRGHSPVTQVSNPYLQ
jgi:hypothetical protein